MKVCTACKENLPLAAFSVSPMYRGGRRHQCNKCRGNKNKERRDRLGPDERVEYDIKQADSARKALFKKYGSQPFRKRLLKYKYGLTHFEYEAKLASQNGVCEICGKINKNHKVLAVDHNHSTNQIRGLLCTPCNTRLNWIENLWFEKALRYLARYDAAPLASKDQ